MGIREIISGAAVLPAEKGERRRPNMLIIWLIIAAVVILAVTSFTGSGGEKSKDGAAASPKTAEEYTKEQEKKLEMTLKKISGAGDVSVYISTGGGGEKVLARDSKSKLSKDSGENSAEKYSEESESQVVTGGSRNGEPYVVEEKTPEIAGVLVVASGAADEKVRLEIYDAVKALYGIAAHRIKVTY